MKIKTSSDDPAKEVDAVELKKQLIAKINHSNAWKSREPRANQLLLVLLDFKGWIIESRIRYFESETDILPKYYAEEAEADFNNWSALADFIRFYRHLYSHLRAQANKPVSKVYFRRLLLK